MLISDILHYINVKFCLQMCDAQCHNAQKEEKKKPILRNVRLFFYL